MSLTCAHRRLLGGFEIRNTRAAVMMRFLNRRLRSSARTVVFFANANFADKCRGLAPEMRARRDVFVLNDGIAMDIAARLLYGAAFLENLNGTDFVPAFLAQLPAATDVYLLGGTPSAVEAAAARLSAAAPHVRIAGWCDGYSCWSREDEVIGEIERTQARILLVAFGNPLQEEWILRHRERLPALIFGVGALFDFVSQSKRRAPKAMQRARLEWLYRLGQEPRRLMKRYTVDTGRFFLLVLRERLARG
jgi:beta-1,4-glucosyltransferase